MIAAVHLDNFLFLLFVAVAIFFQLLTRLATKTRRRPGDDEKRRSTFPPETPRPTTGQTGDRDEDRIRKFLEALGQPATSKPPEPVAPRPTYQKPLVVQRVEPRSVRPTILSPLPPLTTRPPDYRSSTKQQTPRQTPPLAPITEDEVTAAFQPASSQPISKPSGTTVDVVSMSKTTSGLRDAIILREIFGPPRSLQPLDLVGNV
ncbi:MAG TPA: hypothetical protein VNX27_11185 [Chthoniobacterales bacterium]|jgi:hypothetical protein|nr:hypothetical protein [Chthoniobacterales bacterium]